MVWYKRLRWRLMGVQVFAVLLGALSMLVMWRRFMPARLSLIIREQLVALALPAEQLGSVEQALSDSLTQLVLTSIGVAMVVAILAGIVSSLVLWQIIIRPLRGMARSSQRVTDGRYDERVAIPQQAGEAMAQLAHNFNQMADNLETIEQQRVELLGNVTHELRTPLTSLNGYVEGLSDGIFQPSEKLWGSMGRQIGRLTRLVDDIQLLSKVEAGAIHLDLQAINLNDVVNQVVFQLQPKQLEKGVQVEVQDGAEDIYVWGDYDRVTQVLVNLVSNGIQYTAADGQVVVRLSVAERVSLIEVVDTGMGIPAEALPFLFERFYRVDPSRSRDHGGSGVGLTISRHLAWAMGGDLSAHSEGMGQGSRFCLELPLAVERV